MYLFSFEMGEKLFVLGVGMSALFGSWNLFNIHSKAFIYLFLLSKEHKNIYNKYICKLSLFVIKALKHFWMGCSDVTIYEYLLRSI